MVNVSPTSATADASARLKDDDEVASAMRGGLVVLGSTFGVQVSTAARGLDPRLLLVAVRGDIFNTGLPREAHAVRR